MSKFKDTGVIIREEVQALALLTLGAGAAILFGSIKGNLTEDFRMLKIVIASHISGLASDQGHGLLLGIANADLTALEIAACLGTDGPLDRNDRILKETAERFCTIIGSFIVTTVGEGSFMSEAGGPVIVAKPRWTFSNPEAWTFFIYNNTGAALTTGALASFLATHYGVWVT